MKGDAKIVKTGGGSKGIRINPLWLRQLEWDLGTEVIFEIKKGNLIIKRVEE